VSGPQGRRGHPRGGENEAPIAKPVEGHLRRPGTRSTCGRSRRSGQSRRGDGKPTIVLLINGGAVHQLHCGACTAILEGGISARKAGRRRERFIGSESGGKLPITFPHSVGDLPDSIIKSRRRLGRTRSPHVSPLSIWLRTSYTYLSSITSALNPSRSVRRLGQGQRRYRQHRHSRRATKFRRYLTRESLP